MIVRTIRGSYTPDKSGAAIHADGGPIILNAKGCKLFLLHIDAGRRYVVPVHQSEREQGGSDILWILPADGTGTESAVMFRKDGAAFKVKKQFTCYRIEIESESCEAFNFERRPQCDFFGRRFSFRIEGGDAFARALAGFYWDSMLPMVVEKTVAAGFPFHDGYVLSTLQKGAYPGTYPDVDHEFQIKGRVAMTGALDLDIVRRMIELQLDVMRKDPEGKWRNPCSVQPGGNREYHVTRGSLNRKSRAIMFLLTGNIEIIESAWLYAAQTKGFAWLNSVIGDIERVAGFVEEHIGRDFLLWSDVYYEDQVIKDGRETIAQAFAANAFALLSQLEYKLGRDAKGRKYDELSQGLAKALVAPMPQGYWDGENKRFVDWVDRGGTVHDHIHLLANELPLLFGYASEPQRKAVETLLERHNDVFQKFPSFVAAKIEEYTKDEIGDGGPYDLCAAGRYWCWDAAYWSALNDGGMLRHQLEQVAAEAESSRFIMGERYDMNYVYYKSKKNWHGAGHYYEYPNVFAWVLAHEYLGIKPDLEADMVLQPKLTGFGEIAFADIGYSYGKNMFSVQNRSERPLSVRLDLSALYPRARVIRMAAGGAFKNGGMLCLEPGETAALSVEPGEE